MSGGANDVTVVPHYEPVSSGKTMAEHELPAWFVKKVALMEEQDRCAKERADMQRCINEKSFHTVECGRTLEVYDLCQQQDYTPELRTAEEVAQLKKELAAEAAKQ
eukprot:Rhum_TRINITY_DN2359_c0_g1::Rhum_TRINITY_DN2359_c0_g1_i1::g.6985::m.6985